MKFKGKVGIWSYLIILLFVYFIFDITTNRGVSIISIIMLIITLFFLTITLRNYILIENDEMIIVLGFCKNKVKVSEMTSIKKAAGLLKFVSSGTLSFDRLILRHGKYGEVMVSVKESQLFIDKIKELNPNVDVSI